MPEKPPSFPIDPAHESKVVDQWYAWVEQGKNKKACCKKFTVCASGNTVIETVDDCFCL